MFKNVLRKKDISLTQISFLRILAASRSRDSGGGEEDSNSSFSDNHSAIGETLSFHFASRLCLSFSMVVNFIDKLQNDIIDWSSTVDLHHA